MSRKIGVGFNHPRVLGRETMDWRAFYNAMRKVGGSTRRRKRLIKRGLVDMMRDWRRHFPPR